MLNKRSRWDEKLAFDEDGLLTSTETMLERCMYGISGFSRVCWSLRRDITCASPVFNVCVSR